MKDKAKNFLDGVLENRGSWFWMLLIGMIPILLLYRILFLGELIRASDITSQYMWGLQDYKWKFAPLSDLWGPYTNFGMDLTIGTYGSLPWHVLTYLIFPFPVSIAWEIVIHIIFAGIGTFIYSRIIGLNRFSSFLAAIFFILSSEIMTLINAGHVGKINTIAWAPWVFLALEKGLRDRRAFYFLLTGGLLAIQFFEMHWQISFYTCLAVGLYFISRLISIYFENRDVKDSARVFMYVILLVVIFFAASSVSFLPVYVWSKTTERAGGMAYDDGMSWSMPPEELVTYLMPGFFGISRKEAGFDPGYIDIYYWGRMIFTQTNDYMGILPLVLAVAAILYRRNWHIGFFASLSVFSLVVALGKYTPIYPLMYYYLPGFSTFRVPKMILFLFSFAGSIIAGSGAQWLFFDEDEKKAEKIRRIIYGLVGILIVTAGLTLYAYFDMEGLIQAYKTPLTRAFRWVQPPDIAYKRFMNIIWGSVSFMTILLAVIAILWLSLKKGVSKVLVVIFAISLFIMDVWNVNGRFIVTVPAPRKMEKNNIVRFLERDKDFFRVAPFTGEDPVYYAQYNLPVLSVYVAVSEKQFAEYRDRIDLEGNLLDLMNVKYVILSKKDIGNPPLGATFIKYTVVFNDDPDKVVLFNTKYLPRAYPVHQAIIERDKNTIFNILNHPQFHPLDMVVLEEPIPSPLPPSPLPSSASRSLITRYSNDEIAIDVEMAENGFLVLSEKDYPLWKAYVDGKKTKIYKANYVMRSVYLPKGSHKIKFVFEPWPYKVGLFLSSATFLFIIGAAVWRIRKG